MLLALAFAVMTMAVLATLVSPLMKATRPAPARAGFDRAVYRDQLREIERDLGRGVLNPDQAKAARLEIERRLLAAGTESAAPTPAGGRNPLLAAGVAVFVVALALGLYLHLGRPDLPDQPYADRGAERSLAASGADHGNAKESAAKLRDELKQHPDDADKWLLLARTEAALQHWQQSADAYHKAMTLTSGRPDIVTAYGEMLVMAADGIVTPTAHDAFATAAAKDPSELPARFYLALAAAQAGDAKTAIDGWQKLAAEVPEGAPIRAELQRRIEEAAKSAGIPVPALPPAKPTAAPRGPSAQDMAAARNMTPEQRQQMISGMVENLALRLQSNPGDLDGWLRLGRAYAVLKEQDKAVDAYEHAAKLKPDDPAILLNQAEAMLGPTQESPIPNRAVALFHRVEALAPDQPAALWYLGMAAAQAHHAAEAGQYWKRLLAKLPEGSDEHEMVSAAIAALSGK